MLNSAPQLWLLFSYNSHYLCMQLHHYISHPIKACCCLLSSPIYPSNFRSFAFPHFVALFYLTLFSPNLLSCFLSIFILVNTPHISVSISLSCIHPHSPIIHFLILLSFYSTYLCCSPILKSHPCLLLFLSVIGWLGLLIFCLYFLLLSSEKSVWPGFHCRCSDNQITFCS